jgi:nicotinamidase-related amidase
MTPPALDPAGTALLMIDAQEEYFAPGGPNELPAGFPALAKAAELLAAARAAGAHVVHVRHVVDHPMAEEFRAGSPEIEIRPEVAPVDAEPVIDKRAVSAFVATPLEQILREKGVRTVIVAGFMTQTCCTATAHEAVGRQYRTLFASDATAAQNYGPHPHDEVHERALEQQRAIGSEVMTAEAIRALLQGAPAPG